MGEITKIKVNGDPESSYQLYPRNEEFAKRAGDKELILSSSTASSTKKFKITVDDSGTLTATEVI